MQPWGNCKLKLTTYLGEDEDAVALGLELLQQAVEQLQLAGLLQQHVGGGVHHIVGEGGGDQVRVVAVLAHLHDDVVQLGLSDLAAPLLLLLPGQHVLRGWWCQAQYIIWGLKGWEGLLLLGHQKVLLPKTTFIHQGFGGPRHYLSLREGC